MIATELRNEIKGLDELFRYIPEDYSFHDAELEELNWNMMRNELTVKYSCYLQLDGPVYYVTFHITPEMNDFEANISPHCSYTYGIDIKRSDNPMMSKYYFYADNCGPIVYCQDIWVEIEETDAEAFFKD